MSNYRPISLLPALSKILEKVVHRRLYHFLEQQNILYTNQFGLRRKHSTIDDVAKFITDYRRSYHQHSDPPPPVIPIEDLSMWVAVLVIRAPVHRCGFNRLNINNQHLQLLSIWICQKLLTRWINNILHTKLEHYGVRGLSLDWFISYLKNRKHVTYMVSNSDTRTVECGVPQGSVLGPLLFIIYTNDLPNCLNITKAILFADDTPVYMTANNMKHLYTIVNHELDNLTDWFRANKLSLNISKSNYMLFSHLHKELINTEIKLGNTTIPKIKCVKFLGLLIDENLKWDEHIQYKKKDFWTFSCHKQSQICHT